MSYLEVQKALKENQKHWLVTGGAGFIGSNIVDKLLSLGQNVRVLDNFATGHSKNLTENEDLEIIDGDIRDLEICQSACKGIDYVLHQAALGSVPRSLNDPVTTNSANITGFINMLDSARRAEVKSFVYAASSSTYGDHPALPKVEPNIGKPLSPYAVTKYVNELYADVFSQCYGFHCIGLRYFNVFGRRQDPDGAYAAVIPLWTASLLRGEKVYINGDGETSRDFCYIENAIQANILAAVTENPEAKNQVYNVAVGDRTTLNDLFNGIQERLIERNPSLEKQEPVYRDFREGDVRHSQADITKIKTLLGYNPEHNIFTGLDEAMDWYIENL